MTFGARSLALLAILASGYGSTCRSTAGQSAGPKADTEADLHLAGVDTSALTSRERRDWSSWVSELLAPCPNEPVNLAQCVRENRKCSKCVPAAKLLVKQIRDGRTRSQAEEAYYARFSQDRVKTINVADSPALGPASADVTVVEWADFECPHCRHAVPVLEKLVTDHPGRVRFVFKFYPLSGHAHSESTARAAAAAGKQGKFWQMHHALFEHQEALEPRDIERYAKEIGLDLARFRTDWDSETVADAVARDRKHGDQLGIMGTPSMYINGREFDLAKFDMQNDLAEWIDLELQLAASGETDRSRGGATAASAAPSAVLAAMPSAVVAATPSAAVAAPAAPARGTH